MPAETPVASTNGVGDAPVVVGAVAGAGAVCPAAGWFLKYFSCTYDCSISHPATKPRARVIPMIVRLLSIRVALGSLSSVAEPSAQKIVEITDRLDLLHH